MKKLLKIILPIVFLYSCDIVDVQPPEIDYVNLDGEYVVDVINATYVNKISGQKMDTTYTYGSTFTTFSAIEPLDILEVGIEEIAFRSNSIYLDHIQGDMWGSKFMFETVRDQVTQKEKFITIYYYDTRRVFNIIHVDDNQIILRSSGQWQGASPEGVYLTFTLILRRIYMNDILKPS